MKLLSQNGISIIQGLMVSALLAGLALVGTSVLRDQKQAQKGAQTSDEITLLHQLVTNVLQDKKHCTATLVINNAALTAGNWKASATGTVIPSIVTATASGTTPLVTSTVDVSKGHSPRYMNGNVEISGIRVNYAQNRFEVDYRRVNNTSTTAKVITKYVPDITFKIDSGADTCYTNAEAANNNVGQQFCNSLGNLFVWNGNDCTMRTQTCAPNQVFIGINSLGDAICRDTASYADWSNLLDTSTSCNPSAPNMRVNLVMVGNKISIKCTPTGPCTTAPLCANTNTYCSTDTPSPAVNGCGEACGPGTKAPATGTWSYTSWGTCTGSIQYRTATTCSDTCGGGCGPKIESQPCTPGCPNVYNSYMGGWCYAEIGGKCGSRNDLKRCELGSCGISDGTGCTLGAISAYTWINWSNKPCSYYSTSGLPHCSTIPITESPTCVPPAGTSCAERQAQTCSGKDVGQDGCGKYCSMTGTKSCPSDTCCPSTGSWMYQDDCWSNCPNPYQSTPNYCSSSVKMCW